MTLSINRAVVSNSALRSYTASIERTRGNFTRLGTGLRINRAADDVSGLVGSEILRAQVSGLKVINENIQRGVNLMRTAEAGLGQVSDLLIKLRQNVIQAENVKNPDSGRFRSVDRETRDIMASIDRIARTQRFASLSLFQQEAPRTVTFMDDASPTGGKDLTVPGRSFLKDGTHTITTINSAIITDIMFQGVLGEGGLITDAGGIGATANPIIIGDQGTTGAYNNDTGVADVLYFDGSEFQTIDGRDTEEPDIDADGANETGVQFGTAQAGMNTATIDANTLGTVVYDDGTDVFRHVSGSTTNRTTNLTDTGQLTALGPQIGSANDNLVFDLNATGTGDATSALQFGGATSLASDSSSVYVVEDNGNNGSDSARIGIYDQGTLAFQNSFTVSGLNGGTIKDISYVSGTTFQLLVESNTGADPTSIDNVDRVVSMSVTGGGSQDVTGMGTAVGVSLTSIQENSTAGAALDHASLQNSGATGNPAGADFVITNAANVLETAEGDTFNLMFTRTQGGAVGNDAVTATLQNESPSPTPDTPAGVAFNGNGVAFTLDIDNTGGVGNAATLTLSNATTTEIDQSGAVNLATNPGDGTTVLGDGEKAAFDVTITGDNGSSNTTTVNLTGAAGGSNIADIASQINTSLGAAATVTAAGNKIQIETARQNDFVDVSYAAGTTSDLTYTGGGDLTGLTLRKLNYNIDVTDDQVAVPGVADNLAFTVDFTGAGSNGGQAVNNAADLNTVVAAVNAGILAQGFNTRVTAQANTGGGQLNIDFVLTNNTSDGSDLGLVFNDGDDNTSVTIDGTALTAAGFLGLGNETRDFDITVGTTTATINLNAETVSTTANIITGLQNQLDASAFGAGAFTVSDNGGGQVRIQANAGVATIDTVLQYGGGIVITESAGNERTNLATTGTKDITAAGNEVRKLGFNLDYIHNGTTYNATFTADFDAATVNGSDNTTVAALADINAAIAAAGHGARLQAVDGGGGTLDFEIINSTDDAKLLQFTTFNNADTANDVKVTTAALGANGYLGENQNGRTFSVTVGNRTEAVTFGAGATKTTANIVTELQSALDGSAFGAGAFTVTDTGGGALEIKANNANAAINTALDAGGGMTFAASADARNNLVHAGSVSVAATPVRKLNFSIDYIHEGTSYSTGAITADFTGAGSNGSENSAANVVTAINAALGAHSARLKAVANGNNIDFEVVNSSDDAKQLEITTFNSVADSANLTLDGATNMGATGFLGTDANGFTFDITVGDTTQTVTMGADATTTTANIVTAVQNAVDASGFGAGAFTVSDNGGQLRLTANIANANIANALSEGGGVVVAASGDVRTNLVSTGTTDVTVGANAQRKIGFNIDYVHEGTTYNATFTADFTGAGSNGGENNVANIVTAVNAALGAHSARIQAVANGNAVNFEVINASDDAKKLEITTYNNAAATADIILTGGVGASENIGAAEAITVTVGNNSQAITVVGGTAGAIVTDLQTNLDTAFGVGAFTVSTAGSGGTRTYTVQANQANAAVQAALANGGGVTAAGAGAASLNLDTAVSNESIADGATSLGLGAATGGKDNVATALGLDTATSTEHGADGKTVLNISTTGTGGQDNVASALGLPSLTSNDRTGDGAAFLGLTAGVGVGTGGTDNVATALGMASATSTERGGEISTVGGGQATYTKDAATGVSDALAILNFGAVTTTQQGANLETNEHLQFVVDTFGATPTAIAAIDSNTAYVYDSTFKKIYERNLTTGRINAANTIDLSNVAIDGSAATDLTAQAGFGTGVTGLHFDTTRGTSATGSLFIAGQGGRVFQYDRATSTIVDSFSTGNTAIAAGGTFDDNVTPNGASNDAAPFLYSLSGAATLAKTDIRGDAFLETSGGTFNRISDALGNEGPVAVDDAGALTAYFRTRTPLSGTTVNEIVVASSTGATSFMLSDSADVSDGASVTDANVTGAPTNLQVASGTTTRVMFEIGGNTYISAGGAASAALDGGGETNATFAPNGDYVIYEKGGELYIRNLLTSTSLQVRSELNTNAPTFNPATDNNISNNPLTALGTQTQGGAGGPIQAAAAQGQFSSNNSDFTFVSGGKIYHAQYNGSAINALRPGEAYTTTDRGTPAGLSGVRAATEPVSGFFEGGSDVNNIPTIGQSYAIDDDNTIAKSRFYIIFGEDIGGAAITGTDDLDGPDLFTVYSQSKADTTSVLKHGDGNSIARTGGALAYGVVGQEFVSGNAVGQLDLATGGQGLRFTIRPDGQFKVGDILMIDTDTQTTARIDNGPNSIIEEGGVATLVNEHGGTVVFRPDLFIASNTNTSRFQVTSDNKVQIGGGSTPLNGFNFSLVPLDTSNLGLGDLDLASGAGPTFENVTQNDTLFTGVTTGSPPANGLQLVDTPHIVPGAEVTAFTETFTIRFTSENTYDVIGSNFGTISTGNRFESLSDSLTGLSDTDKSNALTTAPLNIIDVRGLEFSLRGKPTSGSEFSFTFTSRGNLDMVDRAIQRVNDRRLQIGETINGLGSALSSSQVARLMLQTSESTIRDADMAFEASGLAREQILQTSAQRAIQQMMFSRQTLVSSLMQTLSSVLR